MRRTLIETLTYPRLVMLAEMDADNCPMHLFYVSGRPACRDCEKGTDCQWLLENDQFQFLAEQPLDKLHQAVRFCIDYIERKSSSEKHNTRRCVCDSCSWLRQAVQIDRDYRNKLAWNTAREASGLVI